MPSKKERYIANATLIGFMVVWVWLTAFGSNPDLGYDLWTGVIMGKMMLALYAAGTLLVALLVWTLIKQYYLEQS